MNSRRLTIALALVAALLCGGVAGMAGARALITRQSAADFERVNGWSVRLMARSRTLLSLAARVQSGVETEPVSELVEFTTAIDSDGAPLNGTSRYVLHFNANALPPADAFWSLTLLSQPDRTLAANAMERVSIGDRTKGVVRNKDGSLDIIIEHGEPVEGVANWLPAPTAPFLLVLRVREPQSSVYERSWQPPLVARKDRVA